MRCDVSLDDECRFAACFQLHSRLAFSMWVSGLQDLRTAVAVSLSDRRIRQCKLVPRGQISTGLSLSQNFIEQQ